jgi:hypothetical protein
VKKTAPVESPVTVTRIGPAKNQLELARFLEWTGIYGDATEGTYRHDKPTGMMARAGLETGPQGSADSSHYLSESLQDRQGVISKTVCHDFLMNAVLTLWAGRSWESTHHRGHMIAPTWHLVLLANHFWLRARSGGSHSLVQISLARGSLCSVLVLQFF